MYKRIAMNLMSLVFVIVLTFVGWEISNGVFFSASAASEYSLNYPTQEEIRQRYQKYAYNTSTDVTYTTKYSSTAPFAMGDISDKDRKNALNALNMCRFVAGLPDDVEISKEYNRYAQAAALVNAANGYLDHFPSKPSGMSDDLYDLGAEGASSSNISMGYTNIADSIINGYMTDSDLTETDILQGWKKNPSDRKSVV